MRNAYLAVGIIVVIVILVAFAAVRSRLPQIGQFGKATPTPTVTSDFKGETLKVSKHTPASTAVIDSARFDKSGFIAIHDTQDGAPGGILGVSELLAPGTYENIVISLSRKTLDGEKLVAMTHDNNGNSTFDPSTDEAAKDKGGNMVQASFQVLSETSGFQIPATGLGEDSEAN